MTVEILDELNNSGDIPRRLIMDTDITQTHYPSSDSNGMQLSTVKQQNKDTMDTEKISDSIESSPTTTSHKSGFMITDILSSAAARNSAAVTLAATTSLPETGTKSSLGHSSIIAAAAAAVAAENDFRARISAAAAALSAAARFNPQSIQISTENSASTEMLPSSVGSQLFVHPHAAAAAAAAVAISSGNNLNSVNDLSGDDLSDQESVSGKASGPFEIGNVLHAISFYKITKYQC